MTRQADNTFLTNARASKKDEFYTMLPDIENEMKHYKKHFKDKTVYCNCDDPRISNFFHYFSFNFEKLGLKQLISTCYKNQQRDLFSVHDEESSICLEYNGDLNNNKIPDPEEIGLKKLDGDGDFRSKESIDLLMKSDIVVTNPPFSLFREFVDLMIKFDKKFLIIGSWNAISYKEIFKFMMENKLWIGVNSNRNIKGFIVPDYYELSGTEARIEDGKRIVSSNNNCWFTNLDLKKRHEDIILYKKYNSKEYPKYSSCDAIEVGKVNEIPSDYNGVMGVPITFMNKYNPDQFEILGLDDYKLKYPQWRGRGPELNGKTKYRRIMIKNKRL